MPVLLCFSGIKIRYIDNNFLRTLFIPDRSITEMSIHDMQMVMHHPDTSTILSRSLSESDLSEICGLGGATGSDPPSPIHMHMAPSDDDDNTGTVVNF